MQHLIETMRTLSQQQRDVVQILLDADGFVSQDRIARLLYGIKGPVEKAKLSRVRSLMTELRQKVDYIENSYGKGYRIKKDRFNAG